MNTVLLFTPKNTLPGYMQHLPSISDFTLSEADLLFIHPAIEYVIVSTYPVTEEDFTKFCDSITTHDGITAGLSPTGDAGVVNKFERFVFSFAYGGKVSEKSCALIAIPTRYWDRLKAFLLKKDPALSLLFGAAREDIPIQNVILENSTPRRRSFFSRICSYFSVFCNSQPLKYLFSSVVAFVIDFSLLLFFDSILPFASMEIGALLAWCVSSCTNFFLNRNFVFTADTPIKIALLEYYGLATTAFVLKTYVFIEIFTRLLHLPLGIAKPIAEVAFYLINYFIQKKWIFKKK